MAFGDELFERYLAGRRSSVCFFASLPQLALL